jgi:hypothetical protein
MRDLIISAFLALGWICQMVRWRRVAEGERTPRSILRVARSWALPPAPSALALTHHRSLVNRALGWPVRFLTKLVARRPLGHHPSRVTPPPSFSVLISVLVIVAFVTSALPIAVVASVLYAFVFPWGFSLRGGPAGRFGWRTVAIATILAAALVALAWWEGITPAATASLTLLLAPVLVAVGALSGRAPSPPPVRVGVTRAPNSAWVVDATTASTWSDARGAFTAFEELACVGQRFVVTPGFRQGDPGGTYLAAARAVTDNARLVAVGRLHADALLDGANGHAVRVDTMKQAIAWVNARLTESDAVLYLGDQPSYLP